MKGARGPRQSPRTLISLLLYHRKGILNSKNAKDFFTEFAKPFSGGFTEKTAQNGVSGHLSARNARPRRAGTKKGAAGMICRRRHSQKAQWGGLEDPQVRQSEFVSPGFSRSLNRRGGRWPRPPLVSLPTFGSLWPLRGQVPTGHTLHSGAGRAGSLRPWAQTFLKHPAKKIGVSRAFPTHDSRYLQFPACRGRRRRRGGSIQGAGAGEAPRAAARSPTG